MVEEAEKFKADDEKKKGNIDARNSLEYAAYSTKSRVTSGKDGSEEGAKNKIVKACDDVIEWIAQNPNATKDECVAKEIELTNAIKSSPSTQSEQHQNPTSQPEPRIEEID